MKVLQISTSDLAHGAGIAAYNLHLGLQEIGCISKMLVAEKFSNNPDIYTAKPVPNTKIEKILSKSQTLYNRALNQFLPQNIHSLISIDWSRNSLLQEADIIHIHNLHWHDNNFSILNLKKICMLKPVIWTLHDMWPVTGHCIYSFDCERWRIGCGKCPDLNSYLPLIVDTTSALCKIKKNEYAKSIFTVITPSQWLANIVNESPLFTEHKIVRIPYGIDNEIYKPHIKRIAKEVLGIQSTEQKVILYCANDWSSSNKGYTYFESAILSLNELYSNCILIGFGKGDFSPEVKKRFTTVTFGYVGSPQLKALLYSSADFFIFPTIADNLPNVVLESMACGTPVVSFSVGGIPDMIQHMKTGYLARLKDVNDLAQGIKTLLNDEIRLGMSLECVQAINKNFTLRVQASRCLQIYHEEIQSRKSRLM